MMNIIQYIQGSKFNLKLDGYEKEATFKERVK